MQGCGWREGAYFEVVFREVVVQVFDSEAGACLGGAVEGVSVSFCMEGKFLGSLLVWFG